MGRTSFAAVMKKTAILWFAWALIVTTVHTGIGSVYAGEADTLEPGTYSIDFFYLTDGLESVSTAQSYMKVGGQKGQLIIAEDGKATFAHEITKSNASNFAYLGHLLPGYSKAVITDQISKETIVGYTELSLTPVEGEDIITLTYQIDNIHEKQDVLMHIIALGGAYDHWYNVQLRLDLTGLVDNSEEEPSEDETSKTRQQVQELIDHASGILEESEEGDGYGQYESGAKAAFAAAIDGVSAALNGITADDEEKFGELYRSLNEAIDQFADKRKLADRTEITQFVKMLQSVVESVKMNGTAEGAPGSATVATVSGEYYHSNVTFLKQSIDKAVALIGKPEATDAEIASQIKSLNYNYNELLKTEYVTGRTMKIYALESLDSSAVLSPYADELEPYVTTVVQKQHASTYRGFYADLTLKSAPQDERVVASIGHEESGSFIVIDLPAFTIKALPVRSQSDAENHKFQVSPFYNADINDSNWHGHGYINYTINGVKREIYISYNAEQLERLQATLAHGNTILALTEEGANVLEETSAQREELEAAIEAAQLVADNLAAKRPDIATAQQRMNEALLPFHYEQYYTVQHGQKAELSAASAYFVKPALIGFAADGSNTVQLTVSGSSMITGLSVKQGDTYKEAQVISVNEQEDSRVVQFNVNDLQAAPVVDAQVSVQTTVNGAEYNQTYDIRLAFNGVDAGALEPVLRTAAALHRGAVAGSAPGQYPQSAKDALAAAIAAAQTTATQAGASQTDVAAQAVKLQQAIIDFQQSVNKSVAYYPTAGIAAPATSEQQGEANGQTDGQTDNDSGADPDAATGSESGLEAASFQDVEGHWAHDAIQRAIHIGIVNGYSDGTFKPDAAISRTEFAVLISRALKLEQGAEVEPFSDQASIPAWAEQHIARVAAAGLISGYGDQTFRGSDQISRTELAVIIARALKLELGSANQPEIGFADAATIPLWAQKEVAAAAAAGIISGKANNRFEPDATATRAEALTLLIRLLDAK